MFPRKYWRYWPCFLKTGGLFLLLPPRPGLTISHGCADPVKIERQRGWKKVMEINEMQIGCKSSLDAWRWRGTVSRWQFPSSTRPPRGGARQKGEATPRHGGLIVFGANTGHPDPIVEASSQVCSSSLVAYLEDAPAPAARRYPPPSYLSLLPFPSSPPFRSISFQPDISFHSSRTIKSNLSKYYIITSYEITNLPKLFHS